MARLTAMGDVIFYYELKDCVWIVMMDFMVRMVIDWPLLLELIFLSLRPSFSRGFLGLFHWMISGLNRAILDEK